MRKSLLLVAVLVVVAAAAGVVWERVASPALWEVRGQGVVLTEDAASRQFTVVMLFLLVGLAVALPWSALAAWRLPEVGWWISPLVVVATAVAAVVAWQVGYHVGPPDPATVNGLADGDTVPSQVDVEGVAPFLAWPIAGLVGVLLATVGRGPEHDGGPVADDQQAEPWSTPDLSGPGGTPPPR